MELEETYFTKLTTSLENAHRNHEIWCTQIVTPVKNLVSPYNLRANILCIVLSNRFLYVILAPYTFIELSQENGGTNSILVYFIRE